MFSPASRRVAARTLGVSIAAALAALLIVAIPVGADAGPIRLSQASATPTAATAGDPVTLSVRYRNLDDEPPSRVWVEVAGRSYEMTGGGGAWTRGATFSVVADDLPVGDHQVTFQATSGPYTARLKSRRVTVAAGAGSGDGSGSGGDAGSGGSGGSSDSGGTGSAGGSGSTGGSAGSSESGGSGDTGGSGSTDGSGGASVDAGRGGDAGAAGSSNDGPAAASTTTSTPDPVSTPAMVARIALIGDGGWDPDDAADDGTGDASVTVPGNGPQAGSENRPRPIGLASAGGWIPVELGGAEMGDYARILSVAMTTTGVVVVTFAFGLFNRRRRDGDPTAPDEVLAARAAGQGTFPAASLVPVEANLDQEGGPRWPTPQTSDPDGHLPRWRRPSVQEARKADPTRMQFAHVAMTFAGGSGPVGPAAIAGVAPVDGLERRRIRYRLVRLLDGPDELRAGEIACLDEGDEVQLISRSGAYWLVHCPDGQQGWIHRMTLGDVVESGGHGGFTNGGSAHSGPAHGVPANGGSANGGSAGSPALDDIDADVLAAYYDRQATS